MEGKAGGMVVVSLTGGHPVRKSGEPLPPKQRLQWGFSTQEPEHPNGSAWCLSSGDVETEPESGLCGRTWGRRPQGTGGRDPEVTRLLRRALRAQYSSLRQVPGVKCGHHPSPPQLLASIALGAENPTLLRDTGLPPGEVAPGCPASCT